MSLEFHTHTRRPHVSRLEDCPDDECLVFCPFHGAMHCSSVTSQEEVAQSEMVMVYLPNSTGVDRLPSSNGYCLSDGYGSYRRGLPQPVDRPSACGLKVWRVVARTHLISLQIVNSPYLSLPNTMVADRLYGGALFKSNSGLFLLPACLFGGEKRSLTMLWFSYQGSTPAVSVRKQGREELRKWKPKPMEAHLPCPVGNLRKAVVGNLLASLPHLWRALIHSCSMTTQCHPSAS